MRSAGAAAVRPLDVLADHHVDELPLHEVPEHAVHSGHPYRASEAVDPPMQFVCRDERAFVSEDANMNRVLLHCWSWSI